MNQFMERWNSIKSAELYGVPEWSGNYFSIAENGEMMVMPSPGATDRAVSIAEITAGVSDRGLGMPVFLRIENILDAQITSLHETFGSVMSEFGYQGSFIGAYPLIILPSRRS